MYMVDVIRKNTDMMTIVDIEYDPCCSDWSLGLDDDYDYYDHGFDLHDPEFCTNANHRSYWKPINQCEEIECIMIYVDSL